MPILNKGSLYRSLEAAALLLGGIWLGSTMAPHSPPSTERTAMPPATRPAEKTAVSQIRPQVKPPEPPPAKISIDKLPALAAFKEGEWVELPKAVLEVSDGYDLMSCLNSDSGEPSDILGGLQSMLKLSPQEGAALAAALRQFVSQWSALQASSAKKVNGTTWTLAASPAQLQSLAAQLNSSVRKSLGDERGYVFQCLSSKSLRNMINNAEMRAQFVDEGKSIRIGGAGESGLSFNLEEGTAKGPLGVILARLK